VGHLAAGSFFKINKKTRTWPVFFCSKQQPQNKRL
jgi:hypothetical protein